MLFIPLVSSSSSYLTSVSIKTLVNMPVQFEVHLLSLAMHNQTIQIGSHKNSMSGTKDPARSP